MIERRHSHVRFGVIGLGVMGLAHARAIARAADTRFHLAAVADANAAAAMLQALLGEQVSSAGEFATSGRNQC